MVCVKCVCVWYVWCICYVCVVCVGVCRVCVYGFCLSVCLRVGLFVYGFGVFLCGWVCLCVRERVVCVGLCVVCGCVVCVWVWCVFVLFFVCESVCGLWCAWSCVSVVCGVFVCVFVWEGV